MHPPVHFPRRRPRWWPENEAWPPGPSHWIHNRSHLFRRIGCLFLLFNLFIALAALLGFSLLFRWLGLASFPELPGWSWLLGLGSLMISMWLLLRTGRDLRRLSRPIGDFLEAAGQLTDGDHSVRVSESGPAEIRSLARAFNHLAERLQADESQRRNLLADVTHELRTPLTVLQGNLEGMLDGVYPTDPPALASLLEETHLLTRLVDDLRTLALAESGALQLRLEPTDPLLLLHETLAALRPQADAAQVNLKIDSADALPLLLVDPARLRQVLVNLLTNALRYTPPGGTIQVAVNLLEEQGLPCLSISIQDSGPGIAAEDLPYIFERFYKSSDSGGMGLGLAIARRLVEAHHGTLQATSQPGQGTTLCLKLPVPAQT